MNAARPADGLLSSAQTIVLLETLGQFGSGMTDGQAARDLSARRAASHVRTYNSIAMLESVGVVQREDDRVRSVGSSKTDWRMRIADWVAREIAARMAKGGAHALQLHDTGIVLDPMLLPGPVDGLRLWLIEFGVAIRAGSSSRRWIIHRDFETHFLDAARVWNRATGRRISQAVLDQRLEDQATHGAEVEEWVLDRERARLATHPLVEQVERISIEDVGAGFDILSFSTPTAVVHDHFLEVKSFSGKRRFFWTRNEIEAARRLGEAYHLCLVDRDRFDDDGYEPELISGPYAALIETEDNGWSISPSAFECIAIDT